MDWMEIGQERRTRRTRHVAVVALSLSLGVAAAVGIPALLPTKGTVTQQSEPVMEDGQQETSPLAIANPDMLAGLTDDQLAAFTAALTRWVEAAGLGQSQRVEVMAAPTAKAGSTVIELAIDGTAVTCSWRDDVWAFEAESGGQGAALVAMDDEEGLAELLGEACARDLMAEWSAYVQANGVVDAGAWGVDASTVKKTGDGMTCLVGMDGGASAVSVTYDAMSGTFELKAA
jgi:hypothetical protein